MTTQPITIENGLVTIRPTAHGVWLTQNQIADLFGVFSTAINANIRAILKSGILHEGSVIRRTRCRNGNIVERYDYGISIPTEIRECRSIQTLDR